jgi:hypothetical protein
MGSERQIRSTRVSVLISQNQVSFYILTCFLNANRYHFA